MGRTDFKSADEIIAVVRAAPRFTADEAQLGTDALLIFQTSKQQTWLVRTSQGLYCVLDDLNKGFTRVQWAIPLSKLVASGRVVARIEARDKTDRTGLLDIGERRDWLFSKKLFASKSVKSALADLLIGGSHG